MGSYEDTISVLEAELAAVERVFAGLSGDQWRLPTKLVPVDPDLPHWTVFELTGHFDIAIGLTRMLIAGREASRPGTGPVSSSTRGRRPHRSSTAMPTRWCRARRPPTCRACCVDLTQALGREPIAACRGVGMIAGRGRSCRYRGARWCRSRLMPVLAIVPRQQAAGRLPRPAASANITAAVTAV
jgi:hypothetical protein